MIVHWLSVLDQNVFARYGRGSPYSSRAFFRLASLALFVMLVCGPGTHAQISASIEGLVIDSSGAPVASSRVNARNIDTGVTRTTTTDDRGRYLLLSLPVGEYEVMVSKPGFRQAIRSGIHLAVGQEASVDLTLQISAATDEVRVIGDAPIVSTTTQDISGLVGEQQIKDLPLNGRSYDLLLPLNPGVVNFTSLKTGGTGISNSTTGNNFAISGNRPQQNLFLLNGVEYTGAAENNMQPGGTSGMLLGVEAVREFNVQRDSYGAEFGKRPGGQVVIVTQSGTNQWHGSVFEFLRNNAFDTSNFFDRGGPPPFHRNQFGVAGGGPIQADKTFLFANYEGFRQRLHQTSAAFVPDFAARAAAVPSVQPLLNLWPTPSPSDPDFPGICAPPTLLPANACGIAQVFSSPLQTIREDFGTMRVDHTFSSRDSLSGIYTIDDGDDFTATPLDPFSADVVTLRSQVATIEETHVFSAALINTARFGYSRAGYFFTGEPTPGTPAVSVPGFLLGRPVGAVVVGGSTASNPTAQVGLAGSNNGSNLTIARNLYTIEDRVALIKRRHQFDFGLWLQPFQSNETLALSQFGQATFTSVQMFLQGTISSFLFDRSPTELNWRSLLGAWYAQDTIRLSPRLTLSLGFRGESSSGWNEAHGRAANYFFTNGIIDSTPNVGNSIFQNNNAKFLPRPRVGVAWSPLGAKTVVRAGFGMYNDLQDALGYRTDQNAPLNPTYSVATTVSKLPIDPAAPVPTGAKLVPGGVDPNMKTPTLVSYSLRVQRELSPNASVIIGYVGSHGYHEIIGVDANEPFSVICPAAPCPPTYPATFPAGIAGTPVPAGTYFIPPPQARPTTTLNNTWTWFSRGDSSYNALQIDFNRRLSAGLSLRGVYTFSKILDDGDSLNATTSGGGPALAANPFNLRSDWGLGTFDVRHVSVISATYLLPIGGGKRYVSNRSGFSNGIISGWSVNSIVTLQGGFPFSPQLSYNPSGNGDTRNPVRPFVNPNFSGPIILGKPAQWFNPNAFLAPTNVPANLGFYGNVGRDTLIGPGLATWDFSTLKDTRIRERLTLQFRAEIFNLLDRANFNLPNAVVFTPSGVSPTAGAITSTSTTSRQVQFGLKLLW
jgi:hypothetical protein